MATFTQADFNLQIRQHLRVSIQLATQVAELEDMDFKEYKIRNLSFGGVFIESPIPYDPETLVHLTFSLPGSFDTIEATGFVCWVNRSQEPQGMGIQFITLPQQAQDHIKDFIQRKSWQQI